MHQQFLSTVENIRSWAQNDPEIQGILLIGSQARTTLVSDRWSDLDLMVFANDPQRLMNDNTWFDRFGAVVCHFDEIVPLHFTNWSWCVKRVLYDDHRDVDFSVLPYDHVDEVLAANKHILTRGWRVLYDTGDQPAENGAANMPEPRAGFLERKIGALLQTVEEREMPRPTAEELRNTVSELLYHVIWAFKKIKRGELWVAVNCINSHMKNLLLWLIEAHNAFIGKRPDFLLYSGRYLEQRADPEILAELPYCFTRYDEADAIQTLEHLFDVTYTISKAICDANGYAFDDIKFAEIQKIYTSMREDE